MKRRRGSGQGQLYYACDLDRTVPPGHLVPANRRFARSE
jgi:hypothetical protein